jgi:hypothetical protein
MLFRLIALFILISQFAEANIRGSDLQNFNPNTNGIEFITVTPTETLKPLQINVGSFFNYTTNSLPYSTVSSFPNSQRFAEPNDSILYSHLHFAMGIMQGWDLGLGAGFTNSQDIAESNFLFSYADTGINDIMLNTKVRVVRDDFWALAFLLGVDFDQIQNNPFTGEDSGPTVNLEAIFDMWVWENLKWAINLGYRIRQQGSTVPNTGVVPLADQVTYSTALSYWLDSKGSAVIGELFGSYPVDTFSLPTDRQLSNMEIQVGYRWRPMANFDMISGIGTELYQGLGSPDIRLFLGVNFRHGFLQQESSDSPPPIQSNQEAFERPDSQELPEKETPPQDPQAQEQNTNPDLDNDGVPNAIDQCPDTPPGSRVNGYGCEIIKYEDSVESL